MKYQGGYKLASTAESGEYANCLLKVEIHFAEHHGFLQRVEVLLFGHQGAVFQRNRLDFLAKLLHFAVVLLQNAAFHLSALHVGLEKSGELLVFEQVSHVLDAHLSGKFGQLHPSVLLDVSFSQSTGLNFL